MKKLMITAVLLIGLISLGYSQNAPERKRPQGQKTARNRADQIPKTPEERARMGADALEKRLNLTPEQKARVYALNMERAEKMEKLRNSESSFRKNQMEKFQNIAEKIDKKLSGILTQEQEKSYQEMKSQQRERMKKQSGQNGKSREK